MLITLCSVLYWFLCGKNNMNNLSNCPKITNVCTLYKLKQMKQNAWFISLLYDVADDTAV